MLESFQVRLRCPKGLSEGMAARAGGNVAPGGPLSMLFFFRLELVLHMHVKLSLKIQGLSHASTHKHAALVSVCHVRGRDPGAGSPDGAATHCSQPLSWAAARKQRTSSRHTLACGPTVKNAIAAVLRAKGPACGTGQRKGLSHLPDSLCLSSLPFAARWRVAAALPMGGWQRASRHATCSPVAHSRAAPANTASLQ